MRRFPSLDTSCPTAHKENPSFTGVFTEFKAWILADLFPDVREKRHKPRALDGLRKFALMLRADARMFRIDDLRLARNKPAEKINFLIIDIIQILRTEEALVHKFSREQLEMSDK